MILSKASLQISALSKRDTAIPGLDCISIEPDGTAVAASKNVVLAISPPVEDAITNIPVEDTGRNSGVIHQDLVKKVITAIGSDSAFGGRLEYCDMSGDGSRVIFSVHDGRNPGTIRGRKEHDGWVPWKKIFSGRHGDGKQVILNRSRLKILLDVLDKIAPENGGETPVYLEFTTEGDVLLRAKNYITGQRILGVMTNYKGKWQEDTEWERRILAGETRRTKRVDQPISHRRRKV